MGHAIEFKHFKVDTDKNEIVNEVNQEAVYYSDSHGGLYERVEFIDKTFDSYDDARNYIDKNDRSYRNFAVKYREYPKLNSKKLESLNEKIKEFGDKENAYTKEHSVRTFKAEYVSCPNCGSKLKRELLRSDMCPLCRSDLRSKSILDGLKKIKDKRSEYSAKADEERKALEKKAIDKSTLWWVVKYEYHC